MTAPITAHHDQSWVGSISNAVFGSSPQDDTTSTNSDRMSSNGHPGLSNQQSFQTMMTGETDAVTAPSTPNAGNATGESPFVGGSSSVNHSTNTLRAQNQNQEEHEPEQKPAAEAGPKTGAEASSAAPAAAISSPQLALSQPSTDRSADSGNAAPSNAHRRSVTISEYARGRREERPGSSGEPNEKASASKRRSTSKRRSLSLGPRREGETSADLLREPRRSIGKRPEEYSLAARDPHSSGASAKGIPRQVAFAAPYTRSGVVVTQPAPWKHFLVPGPLTFGHGQWWYLTVGQSFLAAVISASINFGVACATYNHYDRNTPVRLWTWYPVPLAGDMGVTVIIQQIVSTIITSGLVHHDLSNGPIGPLRRPWPPVLHLPSTPSPQGSWLGVKIRSEVHEDRPLYMGRAEGKGKVTQYFWWFVRSFLAGSERNDIFASGITWRQRMERILWTAVQGFILCLLTFPWFWPISIAIVAPIYGGRNLSGTYIPAIIKLLYGGIMSLLTNPIMALLAMGAESSVRRAYPELEIWKPFGGEQDYQDWLAERNISAASVEIGPRGLARSSTQIRRSRASGPVQEEPSTDSSVDLEAQRRVDSSTGLPDQEPRSDSTAAGNTLAPSALAGGQPINRAITEEP